MNILMFVGAAGGLALLAMAAVLWRAWLRERRAVAIHPVRRLRR